MMKQIQCHTYRKVIHSSGRNHFDVIPVALCMGFQVVICRALGLGVSAHRRLVHGVPGCHCLLLALPLVCMILNLTPS